MTRDRDTGELGTLDLHPFAEWSKEEEEQVLRSTAVHYGYGNSRNNHQLRVRKKRQQSKARSRQRLAEWFDS